MAISSFVKHAAFGAGLMYFFDPVAGRRRRAVARDKATRFVREGRDFLEAAGRDLSNRMEGLVAEGVSRIRSESVDDHRLRERLRATLGHHVSHPAAISVQVRDGNVTLRGPVLEKDLPGLMQAVQSVQGVNGIEDHLDVYASPAGVPALQGGRSRSETNQWSPATRAVAGTLGTALMTNCMSNMTLINMLLGTLGFGMFVRSVTNVPMDEFLASSAEKLQREPAGEVASASGNIPAAPSTANPSFTSSRL